MTRSRRSALLLALLTLTTAACSDAPSAPDGATPAPRPHLAAASASGWDWTGPGAGDVTTPAAAEIEFTYAYDLESCCESGAWTYTATAAAGALYKFDWTYEGFHGWFYDRARAVVWANGPGGYTEVTLVSTTPDSDCEFSGTNCGNDIDGPFSLAGSNSIQLHAGYAWGVKVDGDNGDCCGALNGTLTLTRQSFSFTGFLPPIANPPTVNVVKAGSSVPIKFSLAGDQGLAIFAAGSPSSQQVVCDGAPTGLVEETTTAGNSTLTYDAATDTYTYVWKTEKAWAGTCRELTVKLTDDTEHKALFALK